MKKKYKFNVLSDKTCVVCGNRLKKNLVEKKPTANKCFKHFYPTRNANVGGLKRVKRG